MLNEGTTWDEIKGHNQHGVKLQYHTLDQAEKKSLVAHNRKTGEHHYITGLDEKGATLGNGKRIRAGDDVAHGDWHIHTARSFKLSQNKKMNEETAMTTRFVELAQEQNATEFQSQIQSAIAEKVEAALDARKAEVATKFFAEAEINELSKNTLGNYVDKAVFDVGNSAYAAGGAGIDKDGKATRRTMINRMAKRQKGIRKAADKLSK